MNETVSSVTSSQLLDSGLSALCGIAAYYRIAADPTHLAKELALGENEANENDLIRAAKAIGLKARVVQNPSPARLAAAPTPAILRLKSGAYCIVGGETASGLFRMVDPVTRIAREVPFEELQAEIDPVLILVARHFRGAGIDPRTFGFMWFAPSLWRYRKPLMHVLIASFFVQVFALVAPLFFQVVIDKVLTHRGYSTLFVLVGGLALIGLFDIALQYLRAYALSHTTNRIDVELGQRLFRHLSRLPVSYFETRPTGQTVARMRELETIRSFLTGQGLFSALDLFFTFVFIGVLFAYRPNAPQVLKQISLRVSPGKVVGIVGPSGSGKSTLTKLIQRFYIPEEGQVLLDDMDLSQVDPSWLRSHIGVVLQENLLFNRTIHDNIALSNPAIPRAQVMAIAKLAGADEFIGKLPQGYDTMIEERGANLSGGQRQRIAIARALATNPPILIFDEATSALDYESERIIQQNMRQIVKGRTVFVIAHRLAAVRDCDVIIGMVDGRLVEAGSHAELLKNPQGLYARLWALQNEGGRA